MTFRTATQWVARLSEAQRQGRLEDELRALGRIPLLICDEVGYIPFDPDAANLMFMLISSRYEQASMIVTSNKPFSRWGEIFGDEESAGGRSLRCRVAGAVARPGSHRTCLRCSHTAPRDGGL